MCLHSPRGACCGRVATHDDPAARRKEGVDPVILSVGVKRGNPVHRSVRRGDRAIHTRGNVGNHLRRDRAIFCFLQP